MLKIAVCDDQLIFLNEAKTILKQSPYVTSVETYNEPELFVQAVLQEKERFDVVLLDIHFEKDKNGMQYAKDLMKIAPNMSVIYVTGFNDRYAQHILLEDVKLVGYLTKPLNPHILERYLEKIVKSHESKLFVFSMRGKEYVIVPENIIYFESANHTITIHTDDDEYTFYDKLDCIQERLPSFFLRCHKSYLVNMKRIAQVEPTQVRLIDGIKIPISRINREQVRKTFFYYIGQSI